MHLFEYAAYMNGDGTIEIFVKNNQWMVRNELYAVVPTSVQVTSDRSASSKMHTQQMESLAYMYRHT